MSHHPPWSLWLRPCKKVKRRADAKHHRGYAVGVRKYPGLLLGASKTDKQPPRTRIGDLFHDTLIFSVTERPKWRRDTEYDMNSWVSPFHFSQKPLKCRFTSAVKPYGYSRLLRCVQQSIRRVWPVHPPSIFLPEHSQRPNQGHSIRVDHVGSV